MSRVEGLSGSAWENPMIHTKEAAKNFVSILSDFNTAMENATRLSTFIASRESGLSPDKSAKIAKNITVNFEKKGTATPYISPFYWLINAGVQGSTRMLTGLVKSRNVQIAASLVMAGAYALARYNLARCPEGYSTLDEGIKSRYLIIYKNCQDKYYAKIPFAYGWNAIKYFGDATAMLLHGQKDVTETISNTLSNTVNAFNPWGYAADGADVIENFLPTSMQLTYDVLANQTWFNKPIHPSNDRPEYGIVKDSKNYWKYPGATDVWAIELADALSVATGANNEVDAGAIEVSPNTLQYIKDQLGGGALRTGSDLAGIASDIGQGKLSERELQKFPLVRVFVGRERRESLSKKIYEMERNSFTNTQSEAAIAQFNYLVKQQALAISQIEDPQEVEKQIKRLRATYNSYYRNVVIEKLSEKGYGDYNEARQLLNALK
jgi:hypothetical protein